MGMYSGSSDSSGDQTTTVRYAEYVESHHHGFLLTMNEFRDDILGSWVAGGQSLPLSTIQDSGSAGSLIDDLVTRSGYYPGTSYPAKGVTHDSPYINYDGITVEEAFFSTGYTIASFPSLYDMYGKFMAGLDVDTLFSQIFEDTINSPEVNDLVAAEGALIDDDINDRVLTPFQTGMRDINSVMSSSYIVGKSVIAGDGVKALEKFRSELKFRLLPLVEHRWDRHLEWNKSVIMTYAEVMKLYYSVKMDINDVNYSMAAKHDLWPFTVLDYERAGLGCLQGATKTTTDVGGASGTQKAISGALSGAAMGAAATGTWQGAAVGGFVGLAASLF